jgi:hypothetical protein
MKTSHILIGLFALSVPATIWYTQTAYECPVPLSYRLGDIDPSFSLSTEEALADIEAATQIWEQSAGRDLFVYDESADFTINFVFDERQETLNLEQIERQELDETRDQNEGLMEQVQSLQTQYDKLTQVYKSDVAQYEADLSEYNADVSTYNDRGGAPPDTFSELEAERKRLGKESESLSDTASQLNTLASEINRLSERGNQLISQYNKEVNQYNQTFGFSREFTQGDYQGDKINIYTFSDKDELISVLAHEFGHALGIDHVETNDSLMYYLVNETDPVTNLSADDTLAFLATCGSEETVGQKIRHTIRTLLNIF